MRGDLFVGGGGGEDVLVGDGAGDGGKAGSEAGDAGGEPGLWGDDDLGATGELGAADAFGGVLDRGGGAGGGGAEVEPGFFLFDVTDEFGANKGAGSHKPGADSGDTNAFGAEFGVKAFGVAGEGELGGGVRKQMRDGDFATDRGDIDDRGAPAVAAF